jgi:hypothetical protein
VTHTRSDQCGGACLFPICGPDRGAEVSAQGIDNLDIVIAWPNISEEWPHGIMGKYVPYLESDQHMFDPNLRPSSQC